MDPIPKPVETNLKQNLRQRMREEIVCSPSKPFGEPCKKGCANHVLCYPQRMYPSPRSRTSE